MKAIKRYIKLFKERLEMGFKTSDDLAEGFSELIRLIEHSRQEDEKAMIEIVKKYFDCFHCTWEKSCKNGKIDCSVKDKIIKSMKSHYGGSK